MTQINKCTAINIQLNDKGTALKINVFSTEEYQKLTNNFDTLKANSLPSTTHILLQELPSASTFEINCIYGIIPFTQSKAMNERNSPTDIKMHINVPQTRITFVPNDNPIPFQFEDIHTNVSSADYPTNSLKCTPDDTCLG